MAIDLNRAAQLINSMGAQQQPVFMPQVQTGGGGGVVAGTGIRYTGDGRMDTLTEKMVMDYASRWNSNYNRLASENPTMSRVEIYAQIGPPPSEVRSLGQIINYVGQDLNFLNDEEKIKINFANNVKMLGVQGAMQKAMEERAQQYQRENRTAEQGFTSSENAKNRQQQMTMAGMQTAEGEKSRQFEAEQRGLDREARAGEFKETIGLDKERFASDETYRKEQAALNKKVTELRMKLDESVDKRETESLRIQMVQNIATMRINAQRNAQAAKAALVELDPTTRAEYIKNIDDMLDKEMKYIDGLDVKPNLLPPPVGGSQGSNDGTMTLEQVAEQEKARTGTVSTEQANKSYEERKKALDEKYRKDLESASSNPNMSLVAIKEQYKKDAKALDDERLSSQRMMPLDKWYNEQKAKIDKTYEQAKDKGAASRKAKEIELLNAEYLRLKKARS